MTRWIPTDSLTIGGTDVADYLVEATVQDRITTQIPSCTLKLDNISEIWSALVWNNAIILGLDGTTVFRGRMDKPDRLTSKKDAKVLTVTGRGNLAALQDVVTSMHVINQAADDVVTALLYEYANRKLSGDPSIPITSNLAPHDVGVSFQWKRKDLFQCLQDVNTQLGGPAGDFYDFYANPSGNYYFEPIGNRASGITIASSTETMTAEQHIDSIPVKNDIWLWANSKGGTIPLNMQPGYNSAQDPPISPDPSDPWSEGNAADYTLSVPTLFTFTDDATTAAIGSQSLKFDYSWVIWPATRFYWALTFPIAGTGVVWSAQKPSGHLNCYNECQWDDGTSGMGEQMGEWIACDFFAATTDKIDLIIEVKDGTDTLAQSETVHLEPATSTIFPYWTYPAWVPIAIPFGPSSNYKCITADATFDWSDVVEIRWVLGNFPPGAIGHISVWFDGLRFVKPLIINRYQSGAVTRRSIVVTKTAIANYSDAVDYADGLLENRQSAQIYWDFTNIGRADIPVGQTFHVDSLELLLREADYSFTKDKGWTVKGVGWEKY